MKATKKVQPGHRARRQGRPPPGDWRPAYCKALATLGYYNRACEAAGVDFSTVFRERTKDPSFAAREAEAMQVATAMLEDEALRRARDGMIRFQFSKDGKPLMHPVTGKPYFELEYSDTLLLALLRGRIPERYGSDKLKVEHSGAVKVNEPTDEELAARIRAIAPGMISSLARQRKAEQG